MNDTQDPYRTQRFKYTPIDQARNLANKHRAIQIMSGLTSCPVNELPVLLHDSYHEGVRVHVTHPVNELSGADATLAAFWQPLRHALPDAERRHDLVAAGSYRNGDWIAMSGHYVGTFEHDLVGIPATRGVVAVRFSEAHELREGKIATSYLFVDFLDLMLQAGFSPIVPSLGSPMRWLPPMTHDGVILTAQDEATSRATIERVLHMHAALGYYNGQPPTRETLDLMQMVKHWHPHFMWYGAGGIGTTRGLKGFEDYHQIPFLVAFPDRKGSDIGHFIRIGDGHYAVTGGWGYLQATHSGHDFLGMPPTGKRVAMRVMDFYRCDEQTIVENWVPFDIPHLLLQMGVDVFGRMRHQFRQHQPISTTQWLVR